MFSKIAKRSYTLFILFVFAFPSLSCKKGSKVAELSGKESFKIICYNIYYGMREDKSIGKLNFVDWVKKQDPDVLAIQEVNGFNADGLRDMAGRYGHKYSELLTDKGFPVAITSKYPINDVKKVMTTDKQGYIYANVNGYNIVVLHLDSSSGLVRNEQMKTTLSNTIDAYPSRTKWLVMGDFNCVSPLDEQDLIGKSGSKEFEIQRNLLDNYKLIDVVRYKHDEYIPSARTEHFLALQGDPNWLVRYDFIYASPDLKDEIINSDIIRDDFTKRMSDHYPILLELGKQ